MTPLAQTDYTVTNCFSFTGEVSNFDHQRFMTSLYVESFFTNIPFNERIIVLKICLLEKVIMGNSRDDLYH